MDDRTPRPARDDSTGWLVRQLDAHGEVRGRTAWAYTCFDVDAGAVYRVQGAEAVFVNGDGFAGDPECRGHGGVPVELREGTNHVFLRAIEHGFRVDFWMPATRVVLGTWDVHYPKLTRDIDSWRFATLGIPFVNASTRPGHLHIHYGEGVPETLPCRLTDWMCNRVLAPLEVRGIGVYFSPWEWDARKIEADAALMPLVGYIDGDDDADRKLFRIPLLDHDATTATSDPVRKLPGPLGWAVSGAHLVYGESGSYRDDRALLGTSRYAGQLGDYRGRSGCLWGDTLYMTKFRKTETIALFGNADTNSAWNVVLTESFPLDVRRGGLRVGEDVLEGDDLLVLFRWLGVGGVGSTGVLGARLTYDESMIVGPGVDGDYVVFRATAAGHPRRILAGRWP